jgi:hypothetical protein
LRFLILNTDYEAFLRWFYTQHPGLEIQSYAEQMRVRMEALFGVADFYSRNLYKLGHEAWDIHANNEYAQRAWANEHDLVVKEVAPVTRSLNGMATYAKKRVARKPFFRHFKALVSPFLSCVNSQPAWFYEILAEQIKRYKPDVILNQATESISGRFLSDMKRHGALLVGQIASPLPRKEDFRCYDLMFSSLSNFVDDFRAKGLTAEVHRFGFEPEILQNLDDERDLVPVSFVGSLSRHHQARIDLLEHLCENSEVKVWGTGLESLPENSAIHRCYYGPAWGIEMYRILQRSRITLNCHISVAGSYANNMRLFEATGVGALLVTDCKVNLPDLFEQGKEVVVYRTPEECAMLIRHFLSREAERRAVAKAGQQRTLREHTYYQRMQELVEILHRHL